MMRPLVLPLLLIVLAACAGTQDDSLSGQQRRDFETAEKFEASGNLTAAIAAWRTIVARPDAPAEAHIRLSGLYRKLGRPQEAVVVLRAAEAKDPENAQVLSQLGHALIDARQSAEAVKAFDKLIALDPGNAMHLSAKAVAFDHAGNHVAAQEIYRQALEISPDSAAVRNNLAMSMILNGQYEEAIVLLEQLMAQPDATPTMRHNLALAYGLMGDRQRALEVGGGDLTPEQARENLRFYEEYGKLRKKE